jgi:hypothetical protein
MMRSTFSSTTMAAYHDADCEHHAEERQRIDRIAEQDQPGQKVPISDTGTAERDQGGAPVLER